VDGGAWYANPDAIADAGGAMPAWFGLELMAQSIAAYSGSRHQQQGGAPRPGYLLGTRKYACTVAAFPAGALLEVEVRLQFADPGGLSAFACVLRCDGAELAHAILKVFEPR
jgi:predicted hotdog family 3-hydroxylacyl-ACP dehydratase